MSKDNWKPANKLRGFQFIVVDLLIRKPRRSVAGFLLLIAIASVANAFSFAVFSDSQGRYDIFNDLIDKVSREKNLSFAVNCGDLVASGTDKHYAEYKEAVFRLKIPVYNVMGNHDAAYGGWRSFIKNFGAPYYSFDHENSHFIVLNNSLKNSFDRQQFNWLKADLAACQAEHKFVFMHKPIFDPSELYESHVMSGQQVGEELIALFQKYRVAYVFTGHIHGYAKSKRDGVTYLLTAGAGAPLYLPPEFGGFYNYVIITVDGRKIRDEVKRVYD